MDEAEITAYFIKHLSEGDNPNDLIMDICQKTGRQWTEVEALLKRVQDEHGADVAKRQFPLLTAIALFVFAGGLGFLLYSIYILAIAVQTYTRTTVDPLGLPDMLQSILAAGYFTIGGMVIGVGMILGSLLGMRDVWAALFGSHRTQE